MLSDGLYKKQMFEYLESIIKSELPGTQIVVEETQNQPLLAPARRSGVPNPAVLALPQIKNMSASEFQNVFERAVTELVKECNWHYHNNTCWKYLKRGEPRDDAHCRMRIDGSTRAVTTLDAETHSILLRRLHPRINCYNDVLTFLFQSNNDIKFIGSGEAAKALVYYVTDYITKSPLPSHVGLSAIRAAIQNAKKYQVAGSDQQGGISTDSLFRKCANAIASRQEISHPQVMSYLIGGGDHYTSHKYQTLYWASIERKVSLYFAPPQDFNLTNEPSGNQHDNSAQDESQYTLRVSDYGISTSSSDQYTDYIYRSGNEPFSTYGLYQFVEHTRKVTISRAKDPEEPRSRGPTPNLQGPFLPEHRQAKTHVLRLVSRPLVPVVLGPTIPHPDKSEQSKETWSKYMLILFKPWRSPLDLKLRNETWTQAFDRTIFLDSAKTVMHNMIVLHECKDARNSDMQNRSALALASHDDSSSALEHNALARSLATDSSLEIVTGTIESTSNLLDVFAESDSAEMEVLAGLRPLLDASVDNSNDPDDSVTMLTSEDLAEKLAQQKKVMAELKKRKRPVFDDIDDETENGQQSEHARRRRRLVPASLTFTDLNSIPNDTAQTSLLGSHSRPLTPREVVRQIGEEWNLSSNKEQHLAFKIISDHIINGGEQLLMHLGGVGGTGKSHVISAVVTLLERLQRREELLLSAPTGAAAIVIGGYTIHALTMLPQANANVEELAKIWKHVRYLFIDEVSMVHALFLAQISERILKGKGGESSSRELPFGGVNVIFTGDFGQLFPVGGTTLFSSELHRRLSVASAESLAGQSALMGAWLWIQVNVVVLLQKNQRQADDKLYANLLHRLRAGGCNEGVNSGPPAYQTDYDTLKSRIFAKLCRHDPSTAELFSDAPVIVGRRSARDAANRILVNHAATRDNKAVYQYHSVDKLNRKPLEGVAQEQAWAIKSSTCNDSLGTLPLFEGMKVMITENVAISKHLVNGAEAVVRKVVYDIDAKGRRFATVCYVHVPGSGILVPGEEPDIAPLFPVQTSFSYRPPGRSRPFQISRTQLPLVPAYSYTDYKSQGRTLPAAIVDLESARSLQGVYVMLSRVKTLRGITILREFDRARIETRPSQDLRDELSRLDQLHRQTMSRFANLLDNSEISSVPLA